MNTITFDDVREQRMRFQREATQRHLARSRTRLNKIEKRQRMTVAQRKAHDLVDNAKIGNPFAALSKAINEAC